MSEDVDSAAESSDAHAAVMPDDEDARISPATAGWILGSVALVALSAWIYRPTLRDGWTRYDNMLLIAAEPKVRDLSAGGLRNIFSSYHHDLYQPLLTLSLAIDYKLFGRDAAASAGAAFPPTDLTGWHLHSLGVHLVTVVLFFLLIGRMTGHVVASWIGAALVALHPLMVEPVSWLICRTFLLAGFWIVLGCHFWLSYARRPRWWLYLFSMVCFGLSMLAKLHIGLLVLPLLLDLWCGRRRWGSVVLEKLPLMAMIGVLVYVNAQRVFGESLSEPLPELTVSEMIRRGLTGLFWTTANTFVPQHLSVFYGPRENPWALFASRAVIGAGLGALVWIVAIAARIRGRVELLACAIGWSVMFLPLMAAIRVRETVTADRYNYVPLWLAGLAVAWGLSRLFGARDEPVPLSDAGIAARRPAAYAVVPVLLLACGWLALQSRAYARIWTNDVALWQAAVDRTPHRTAYGQLANALITEAQTFRAAGQMNRVDEHLTRAEKALQNGIDWERENRRLVGNVGVLFENYGVLCMTRADDLRAERLSRLQAGDSAGADAAAQRERERTEQMSSWFEKAAEERPGSPSAWNGLGVALMREGELQQAKDALERSLELAPGFANAQVNLATVLTRIRRNAEAVARTEPSEENRAALQAAQLAEAKHLERIGRQDEANVIRAQAGQAVSALAGSGDAAGEMARAEASLSVAAELAERGPRLLSQLRNPNLTEEQKQNIQEVAATASAEMNARAQTAEAICRRLLEQDDTSSRAWGGLAQALMYQARIEEAREAFARAIECDPDDARVLAAWGRLLAATGDMDGAAEKLGRAIEIDPDLEPALYDLARIRVGRREYEAAAKLLERLYRLKPDNALYRSILRQLYQELGRNEDAAALQ